MFTIDTFNLGSPLGEKSGLAEEHNSAHSGSAAYVRHLVREIAGGRLREPPEKERIGKMYWNQKDQAVLELGGHAKKLFVLWVVAAELAYQQNDVFGTVEDLAAHKARIAELEAKRKELYGQFPSVWTHGDLHVGRITSDGAALITFRLAPNEIPLHPFSSAGERLVDYLLKKESETGRAEGAGGLVQWAPDISRESVGMPGRKRGESGIGPGSEAPGLPPLGGRK